MSIILISYEYQVMDKVRRPVFKNSLSTTLLSSRSKEFLSLLGGCEEMIVKCQCKQAATLGTDTAGYTSGQQ